jgi:hypothetical protein
LIASNAAFDIAPNHVFAHSCQTIASFINELEALIVPLMDDLVVPMEGRRGHILVPNDSEALWLSFEFPALSMMAQNNAGRRAFVDVSNTKDTSRARDDSGDLVVPMEGRRGHILVPNDSEALWLSFELALMPPTRSSTSIRV